MQRHRLAAPATALIGLFLIRAVFAYPGDVFQLAAPAQPPASGSSHAKVGKEHSVSEDGAVQYGIPLPTAPGRQGMAPSLSLSYSSRGPIRGGIAAGWTLNVPVISLDTSRGRLADKEELSFRSSLSAGRLVPVDEPTEPGVRAYRAENDGDYLRYERVMEDRDTSGYGHTSYWRARAHDGKVYTFGDTPSAKDTPVPDVSEHLHEGRWFVTRIEDRFGNRIDFSYKKVEGDLWNGAKQDVPVDIALNTVEWGANDNAGLSHHARLVFDYAPAFDLCPGSNVPIGASFNYRTGFANYEGAQRLDAVRLQILESGGFRDARKLELFYDEDELSCESGRAHAPLRLLTGVQETAYRDGVAQTKPAATFSYGRAERLLSEPFQFQPPQPAVGIFSLGSAPLGEGKNPLTEGGIGGWPTIDSMLLDLDGDGMLDILWSTPFADATYCATQWQRNNGDGTFAEAQPFGVPLPLGAGQSHGLPVIPWYGATRDTSNQSGLREGCSLSAQYTRASLIPDYRPPGGSYQSYRFMDVTGDGRPDLVTGVDAKRDEYQPEDDARLYPNGLPQCQDAGPCREYEPGDSIWEPAVCKVVSPLPTPPEAAFFSEDQPPPSAPPDGCPQGTCRYPACPPDIPCMCIGCGIEDARIGNEYAPGDDALPDDGSEGNDPFQPWGGPAFQEGNIGGESESLHTTNPKYQYWPEMQCGRYVLRVYENLGDGVFDGTPREILSPIPLESDRPTSRLGSGPLTSASSWHGFIDIDGDSYTDAVYMEPFFFDSQDGVGVNDLTTVPANFWVFRGDGVGNFTGDSDGFPYLWRAPRIADSNGEPSYRARVSLNDSTDNTSDLLSVRQTQGVVTLKDINGDGLPDYVDTRWHNGQSPRIRVFYNTGTKFENRGIGVFDGTVLHGERDDHLTTFDSTGQFSFVTRYNGQMEYGWSRAALRPVDIDADGLTDLVDIPRLELPGQGPNDNNPWHSTTFTSATALYVNVGDRLVPMGAPAKLQSWKEALGRITLNFGDVWSVRSDFVDVDGDGLPEAIHNNQQSSYCAPDLETGEFSPLCERPPLLSGQNNALRDPQDGEGLRLLKEVKNGQGGEIYFTYAPVTSGQGRVPHPLWVVRDVTVRAVDPSGLPVEQRSEYLYENPVYNRGPDGLWGFRGFEQTYITSASGARIATFYDYGLSYWGLPVETRVYDQDGPGGHLESLTRTIWGEDPLFEGLVKTYHKRAVEQRTCGAAQTEAQCEQSGALRYEGYHWAPVTHNHGSIDAPPGGLPAVMYQQEAAWVSDDFVMTPGSKHTEQKHHVRSTPTEYRAVPDVESRYVFNPTPSLIGQTDYTYDADLKLALEVSKLVDLSPRVSTTSYLYDDQTGNVRFITKPKFYGQSVYTELRYDPQKLFVETTVNELGHEVDTTYDLATGALLSARGPNAKTYAVGLTVKEGSARTIDAFGRPLSESVYIDDPVFGYKPVVVTLYSYQDEPAPYVGVLTERRIEYNEDRWVKSLTEVDGLGRVVRETSFENGAPRAVSRYFYGENGKLSYAELPAPNAQDLSTVTFRYTYDRLGRELQSLRPDGSGVETSYDGRTVTRTDIDGGLGGEISVTRTTADAYGRLIQVEEALDDSGTFAVTAYEYDGNNNLTRIESADGSATSMTHDFLGRRLSVTTGGQSKDGQIKGGQIWRYSYDDNGNLTSVQAPYLSGGNPAPYLTTILYDELDRPTSRFSGAGGMSADDLALFGAAAIAYTYDQGANGRGQLTGTTQPGLQKAFAYDALGRLIEETSTFDVVIGDPFGDSRVTRAEYNALGQPRETLSADGLLSSGQFVDATRLRRTYDDRGLPRELSWVTGQATWPLVDVTRKASGAVEQRRHTAPSGGSVAEERLSYDELGRIINQRVSSVLPGNPALTIRAEQVTWYTGTGDMDGSNTALSADTDLNYYGWEFRYDKRHQLIGAYGPADYRADFDYTADGRVSYANVSADPSAARVPNREVRYDYDDGDPDAPDMLRDTNGDPWMLLEYDLAGNVTLREVEGQRWLHTYDGANLQRRVWREDGGQELYWYDTSQQRVLAATLNSDGSVSRIRWTVGDTELWYDGAGQLEKTIVTAGLGAPMVRIEDRADARALFHDARGDLLASLDAETGELLAGFSYGPFGELLEQIGPDVDEMLERFNGKEFDETSGLSYYGYRYYDDHSLTWTQADPLYRFAPDIALAEPRRMRTYAFTLNNPLRFVDTNGLDSDQQKQDPPPTRVASSPIDYRDYLSLEIVREDWVPYYFDEAKEAIAYGIAMAQPYAQWLAEYSFNTIIEQTTLKMEGKAFDQITLDLAEANFADAMLVFEHIKVAKEMLSSDKQKLSKMILTTRGNQYSKTEIAIQRIAFAIQSYISNEHVIAGRPMYNDKNKPGGLTTRPTGLFYTSPKLGYRLEKKALGGSGGKGLYEVATHINQLELNEHISWVMTLGDKQYP